MNIPKWLYTTALLALAACSDNEHEADLSYIGQPIEVDLCVEGVASSRAVTGLTTGTAYLNSGSGMKSYTYSDGTFTSTDPLVWTGNNMTINGYYADNGQTAIANTLIYSIDYSASDVAPSFLAGQTTANYEEKTRVSIILRQQLARIYVTVAAEDGSTISSPQLNGVYTSGTFQGNLDVNGYAEGGTNHSGWNTSGSTATINMSDVEGTEAYQVDIIPQTIDASTNFFSVEVNGLTGHFKLASTITFIAGRQYNLSLEKMSQTLTLESSVLVNDFTEPDSNTSISTSDVTPQ